MTQDVRAVNRRDLLRVTGAGAFFGMGGCLSAPHRPFADTPTPTALEQCSDREFPDRHLGVIKLELAEQPAETSTVIRYENLPPGEQRLVETAIERDRLAICLPEATNGRADQFRSLVSRIRDGSSTPSDGPYLRRNSSYYRFTHVRSRDQVFVTVSSPTPEAALSEPDKRLPFGTTVELGDAKMTLSHPHVRKAIAEDFGIWQEVRCDDGQYLLAKATTDGNVPTRFTDIELFSVVGDGVEVEDVSLVVEGEPGEAPRVPSKWDNRTVAFYFPDENYDRAAIRWETDAGTADWELGDEPREQLRIEPQFALEQFEISRDGDDIRMHLRVENSGERTGQFLGQVSFEGVEDASSMVSLSVPTDETTEFRGVPRILRGIANDGRVVTLAYSDGDSVTRIERTL